MKNHLTHALLFSMVSTTALADGIEPMQQPSQSSMSSSMQPVGPSDSRMKTLTYNESDVYTITTKYGYQTSIVFGKNEEMQTISVGDRSLWQIIPNGNRLFIRPMEEGAVTNMTVLTSKHSYQFDLKSLEPGKGGGNIYVAQFTYPDARPKPPPVVMQPAPAPMMAVIPAPLPEPAPQLAPPPASGEPLYPNYRYTYAGPDALAPLQVFDDGKSTFIKYRDMTQPIPNAYVVDAAGRETPVTYAIRNELMVLEIVAPELVLKNSDGAVHVYNEMLNPG